MTQQRLVLSSCAPLHIIPSFCARSSSSFLGRVCTLTGGVLFFYCVTLALKCEMKTTEGDQSNGAPGKDVSYQCCEREVVTTRRTEFPRLELLH